MTGINSQTTGKSLFLIFSVIKNKKGAIFYVILLFCLMIWATASAAEVGHSLSPVPLTSLKQNHAEGGLDRVTVRDGLVTLDVHAVSLKKLLKKIAETARIDLSVDPGIEEKVTVTLDSVPLDDALKELCRSRAMIYQYNAKKKVYRIVGISVQQSGDAQAQMKAAKTNDSNHSTTAKPPPVTSVASAWQEENLYDSQGRLLYKPRELLVKFRKGATGEETAALHRTLGSTLISAYEYRHLHRIKIKESLSLKEAADLYRASPLVDRVERHALRYADAALPNDSDFNLQWGLHNIGQSVNYIYGRADADIDAPEGWDIIDRDREIVIAVIDTGMDYNHPDLTGRIWLNPGEVPNNNIDDDGNGYIDDVRGWDFAGSNNSLPDNDPMDKNSHGTHVSGLIGALKNNGLGIAGIFPKARIMVLKVESDIDKEMQTAKIVRAIDYARQMGVRIVNCSYGGASPSDNEYEALANLKSAGILTVCSAGNSSQDMDDNFSIKNYPAYYAHSTDPAYPPLDNLIAVAASNQTDGLWSSSPSSGSNYGLNTVDLMAPGVNIWSTVLNSDYAFKIGTSMAAPYVTAVAGLVLSRDPKLTYLQVKEAILTHVDVDPNPTTPVSDMLITGGRLNAFKALSSIHLPGDLNGDHKIGPADMILGLQIVSGTAPAYSWVSSDDIDKNGNIGLEEVIYIMQWIAFLRDNG